MSIPVVVSKNGYGLPVRAVEKNAPEMTVADWGIPIIVSDWGIPFIVRGLSPITATSPPIATSIATGARLDTMTDWATFAGTGNYASTEGTISSVVAKLDGTTRAGSYTPADGSYALTFEVTDSAANVRVFQAGTLDVGAASIADSLLLETGGYILLENGGRLILEAA